MNERTATDKKLVYFKGSFEEWEWSVEEKQKRFGRLKEVWFQIGCISPTSL